MRKLVFIAALALIACVVLMGGSLDPTHLGGGTAELYGAAFSFVGLRRIAHGGAAGSTPVGIFSYATNHTIAEIEAADFFLPAYQQLAAGDIMFVAADLDGTPKFKSYQVTTSNSATVVVGAEVGAPVTAAAAARAAIQQHCITLNLADIANGDVLTGYVPGFNGKILATHAFAAKAATTAAKAASLNWEIGTTDTTGGVLALTSANMTPQGAKVDASAITAANVFTNTDALSLEASGVTAFVEGVVHVVTLLENTDLLNALQA